MTMKEPTTYNSELARKAQDDLCDRRKLPHFAPLDGICFYCGGNIYKDGGVSVEEAGKRLITSCPLCRRSYCE